MNHDDVTIVTPFRKNNVKVTPLDFEIKNRSLSNEYGHTVTSAPVMEVLSDIMDGTTSCRLVLGNIARKGFAVFEASSALVKVASSLGRRTEFLGLCQNFFSCKDKWWSALN
jgi:hypothetical protein